MKPLPYFISKKAISDGEEIWLFTAEKWSFEQADRYYNLIFDGKIDFQSVTVNLSMTLLSVPIT